MSLKNPSAYYSLNGNANKTVGTNNGVASGVTWAAGKIGQAAYFNGSASIQIPTSSDFTFGTSDFTAACWVKFNANGIRYIFLGQSDSSGVNSNISFFIDKTSSNNIRAVVCYGSSAVIIQDPGTITDFGWHLVLLQRENTTLRLLIDNVEVDSGVIGLNSINNPPYNMGIGAGGEITVLKLDGAVDEFGFWPTALTPQERTRLYNNGNGSAYPFSNSSAFFQFL